MKKIKQTGFYWLWIAPIVIILDQATKQWIAHTFTLYQVKSITSFFDLTFATNRGVAFSFLNQSGPIGFWLLTAFTSTITIILTIWLYRSPKQNALLNIALSMIIGGAIGNLIDRLAHGHVIDFIALHIGDLYWPAFNIADSAITIGALLIIVDLFRNK